MRSAADHRRGRRTSARRARGRADAGLGAHLHRAGGLDHEDPIETGFPAHWYKLGAVDFGIDHPFGYVLICGTRMPT
jgi:hypothetical protein